MNNPPENPLDSFDLKRRILVIFNIYRLALIVTLFTVFGILKHNAEFELLSPFSIISSAYFLVAGISLLFTVWHSPGPKEIIIIGITDLVFLWLLSLYNLDSSLASINNLMIVTVLISSIISSVRGSLLIASVATSIVVYGGLFLLPFRDERAYTSIAFSGAVLMFTAVAVQYLMVRLRSSELLSARQAQDIVDLQQINQSIVNRMHTAILVCSQSGIIKLNNPAAEAYAHQGDLLHEVLFECLQQWQQNQQQRFERIEIDQHGQKVHPSFLQLNPNQENSDILIFLEDSLELTQRAQHLKLASLGRLTASIAHEIRNPLGAISQAGQLLNEAEYLLTPDRKLLNIIDNHSKRINNIINTILSLGKNEHWQPEVITIRPWLTHFLQGYKQGQPSDMSISIDMDDELCCRFEEREFEQILCNLLDNAVRYSHANINQGKVVLTARIDEESQCPWLEVRDFGIGLNDDQKEHLFEPFYTTSNTGTGLGLYICQQLCENNQARLSANNWADGASFRISFAHPDRIIDINS
jgi:two-component system, NtrC family, sensor histidine kinase PilS